MTFTESIREMVAITEASVQPKSKMIEMTIIKAGFGNKVHNHYYSPNLLEAEASKFVDAPMYADHPDPAQDRRNGGVRSVRDLVGKIKEAWYDPNTQSVKGRAQVLQNWLWEIIENDPRALAVSIRAAGTAKRGEAEGRTGNLVESFRNVKSVDYVTVGGAGGQVESILESQLEADMDENEALELVKGNPDLLAKVQEHIAAQDPGTNTPATTTTQEGGISEEKLAEIVEGAVTKATEDIRTQHAKDVQLMENRRAVEKRVERETGLPSRTRQRITDSFHDTFYEGDIEEGDKTLTAHDQLMRDVEAAIEEAKAEFAEYGPGTRSGGRVTGMGPSGGAASFAEGGDNAPAASEEEFREAAPTATAVLEEFGIDTPWGDEDDDDNDDD